MCSLYLGENLISGNKPINLGVRNIGEIVASPLPLTDAGLHLLDGSLILGGGIYQGFVDYIAELYTANPSANYFTDETTWQNSVTTYGVCGKFVYDSVNNTVRLPKITGIIEGTTDLSALGDLVEAGLPVPSHTHTRGDMNITGNGIRGGQDGWSSGAFVKNNTGRSNGGTYPYGADYSFNAANSWTGSTSQPNGLPSIFGNSSTVQPQTIKVLYYIVIANSTKTEIQSDIDEIATDLNGKADVDFTNVTDTGYIKMAGASMPSDTYIDLTLGASGSTYTAPADGWFCFDSWVTGAFISLQCGVLRQIAQKGSNTGIDMSGYIPVTKGQTVTLGYDGTWQPHSWQSHPLCFIYAQGSESEAQ